MVVNYTYTGKTGGFFWEFDPNAHILTLSGNGSMPDYEPEFYSIPTWMKFRGNVDEVRFDEGITRIGSNSFFSFDRGRRTLSGPHLKRVVFPSTLQAIGHSAFRGNPNLETISRIYSIPRAIEQVNQRIGSLRSPVRASAASIDPISYARKRQREDQLRGKGATRAASPEQTRQADKPRTFTMER